MIMTDDEFRKVKADNNREWYKNRVFFAANNRFKFKIVSADYGNNTFHWVREGETYNHNDEECLSIIRHCSFVDDIDSKIMAIEAMLQSMKKDF